MRACGPGTRALRLPLLLSLAALCLSEVEVSGPIMTTQSASQQTQNILYSTSTEHNVSTPGSTITTEGVHQQTRESFSENTSGWHGRSTDGPRYTTQQTNLTWMAYNISIPGFSSPLMEKNITLDSPANIELSCTVASVSTHAVAIEKAWKKDTKPIKSNVTSNETKNVWSTQYKLQIREKKDMGSYMCVMKGEHEVQAVFHLKVPKIKGKEKPIVSYEGDSVVIVCESGSYIPITWIWYTTNGSHQVPINDSLMPEKYIIDKTPANKTHLKIMKLTGQDGGLYVCQAVFKLGENNGEVNLKVLNYMVPLKPFFAIAAEVIVLVALIFLYEIYSKKKEMLAEGEKEFEQIEQLKSEESNGVENSSTRHRKV
ncbi:PREDICTED: embigin [Crocodylus porosus]|uniref:embigin n=1 Tax=Crocodylus porosus TaxID=8502 RepID=UPI00093F0FDB|nr:PREDICTED: embigin [Crocodylus porosus]XP_019387581.1 PREDICTED: embigin [Crocodylus porosus]